MMKAIGDKISTLLIHFRAWRLMKARRRWAAHVRQAAREHYPDHLRD